MNSGNRGGGSKLGKRREAFEGVDREEERGGKRTGSGGLGRGRGRLRLPAGTVGFRGKARAIVNQGLAIFE